MSEVLLKRAREIRSRALVRAWEYRQRNFAKGVWFKLRRVLVGAAEVYAIDDADAATLIAEGFVPQPCGALLEPPKTILFAPADRVARVRGRRVLPLRLGAELLGERNLLLVPLEADARS